MSHLDSVLYPFIIPRSQHSLQVDNRHTLYIEECGNPKGIPVLFVHGGPGGGISPTHRRYFNPDDYRIILFDQRGCGKSQPHACLTDNTTPHLVEDMEKIRRLLDIDEWILFGGSWGSTLSLLYAQTYPERVLGLVLRGIFLCRDEDIQWFYQSGANRFYPDIWPAFLSPIPIEKQHNMVSAYHDILTGDNEILRMKAAEAWSAWEGKTSTLQMDKKRVSHFASPHHALAMARIECHYFYHQSFIEPNQILDNMAAIAHIPTTIVQGRYDMVCPINQAYELHQSHPLSTLIISDVSGHSAMEEDMAKQLIAATDAMLDDKRS